MDAYIYNAALYCDACGESIRDRIAREGHAPADPDDECSYDSDEFPKGPFADGGGEADSPHHCDAGAECLQAIEVDGRWIGAFLENPLTTHGLEYVRECAREELTGCVRLWCDHYGVTPEYRGDVTASFKLGDRELDGIPVVNPGGWFGKTWLIEVGCGYSSFYFVVEADSACDAIDEFSDSPFGHWIHVAPEDAGDYDDDSAYHDGSGRMIDLENVRIEGQEGRGVEVPFPCRYHADGLPTTGIDPRKIDLYSLVESESAG